MKKLIFLGGEDVSARIEISKKFMELEYNISIIGTEEPYKFIKNGIEYKRFYYNREFSIVDDIKSIFELRAILKEIDRKTIVHSFDSKPSLFLPIASIGLKHIKVSRTITGLSRIFSERSFKNNILIGIYEILQNLVKSRVDFTIFQNSDDFGYFLKKKLSLVNKAVIVKSSGIDLENFSTNVDTKRIEELYKELSIDKVQKVFILIGRMIKYKGILNYLKSAKLCYEEGYRYKFLLVGQLDTDKSVKQEEIDEYSDYVSYLGRREDIKELLAISDIFVLPTYYREGVPRVLLEASAMGLGLITTDMPGCRDVVIDDYNGKLVEIENSKDLCSKMIYMAEDEERLEKYQEKAKEKVKEFDLNRVVAGYDAVYQKLLAEVT
jgi:glycosyltransferase involved in cell wall biosynthesis